jgi:transcriptional regulator with XRE-family HTH domain
VTPTAALGARVRERRLALGLAQSDLAGPKLSASYVSLIEAGKRTPTEQTLQHLAARLRCTMEFLRDGTDVAERESQALAVVWLELALSNGDASEVLRRIGEMPLDKGFDPQLRWRAERARAAAHEAVGDLEAAVQQLEALREQAEAAPDRWPLLSVVVALTRCYREAGDVNRSLDLAQRALAQAEELGLEESAEHAELAANLVAAYFDRGDLVHAGLLAKRLIARVTNGGTRRAQAAAYWNASVIAQEHGKLGESLALAEKALACLADEDQQRNLARLRLMYAGLLLRADPPQPKLALGLIEDLLPGLTLTGSAVDLAYADTELARAHLQLGEAALAVEFAGQALTRLGDAPRLETAEALTVLALGLRDSGDTITAAAKARQAAQLLSIASNGRKAAAAWNQLGDILMQLDERDEAIRAYKRAISAMGVVSTIQEQQNQL